MHVLMSFTPIVTFRTFHFGLRPHPTFGGGRATSGDITYICFDTVRFIEVDAAYPMTNLINIALLLSPTTLLLVGIVMVQANVFCKFLPKKISLRTKELPICLYVCFN